MARPRVALHAQLARTKAPAEAAGDDVQIMVVVGKTAVPAGFEAQTSRQIPARSHQQQSLDWVRMVPARRRHFDVPPDADRQRQR